MSEFKLVPLIPTLEMLEELTNGDPKKNALMKQRWRLAVLAGPMADHDKRVAELEAELAEALELLKEAKEEDEERYILSQQWHDAAQAFLAQRGDSHDQ